MDLMNSSSSSKSLPSEYLSIDDLIALSTKVTTKMETSVRKLGFIDPAADSENLIKGTKLELPIWLARELYSDGLATFELPKGFNETFREVLEADANVVDLHKLGPNYYTLGQHLATMRLPESELIAKSMVNTFYQRLRRIMDHSSNASSTSTPEVNALLSNLDNEEIKLFHAGRAAMAEFKRWENRSIERIEANELVNKLRKRKRAAKELDG